MSRLSRTPKGKEIGLQTLTDKLTEIEDKNNYIVINSLNEPTQQEWENAFMSQTGQLPPIPVGYKFIWYCPARGFSREYIVINDENNGTSSSGTPIPSVNPKNPQTFRLLGVNRSFFGDAPNFPSDNVLFANNPNSFLINNLNKAREEGLRGLLLIVAYRPGHVTGGEMVEFIWKSRRDNYMYSSTAVQGFYAITNGSGFAPTLVTDYNNAGDFRIFPNVSGLLSSFDSIHVSKIVLAYPEDKDNGEYREHVHGASIVGTSIDYNNSTFLTAGAMKFASVNTRVSTAISYNDNVSILKTLNNVYLTSVFYPDSYHNVWVYGYFANPSDMEY